VSTDVPINFGTRVCNGPAHHGPARLPLTETYWAFYRSGPRAGKPIARCKLCRNWQTLVVKPGPHGRVDLDHVYPIARELLERCGSAKEVERRHGIPAAVISKVVARTQKGVYARTAGRLIVALGEQRKYDRRNGASARFVAARRAQGQLEERLERLAGY